MDENPLELVLKTKSADEVIHNASSSGWATYGWVILLLLLIVVGIGVYKICKDKK